MSLVAAHLGGIQRALLEGDKRPAFLAFLNDHLPAKQGIYALYDKKGECTTPAKPRTFLLA
jgi:hypothetical protein